MYRFLGSDDEDPFEDDDPFEVGRDQIAAFGNRRRRRNRYVERDNYFFRVQQSVIEEEIKSVTIKDEERLFDKINMYLKKPFVLLGILTLQRLAFVPSTVSAERIKEIAKIICKNIFTPISVTDDYTLEYVDFCKAFAYLKGTTNEGSVVSFEQLLISEFLEELPKKFNYSQRLKKLLDNRDIPQEKKSKWLAKQIEEQQSVFETITKRSISFIDHLFQLYPEIVYRVIEFLLKSDEEDGFKYLCALLEKVRYKPFHGESGWTNMYKMKLTLWERNQQNDIPRPLCLPVPVQKEALTSLFASITTLSSLNNKLPQLFKDIIQNQIIDGNPLKENVPQDYIKYCIKDCLQFEKFEPEDDFKIDAEDEFECSIYTLRSKDFNFPGPMHFWKGLKVKILTKNISNTPGQKFKFQRANHVRPGRSNRKNNV